jgi:hypothetical protein
MSKFGILNFVRAANEMVNAKTSTLEGLERWLISWFCLKFNTSPNDDRLQEMTLEELVTLFYMHKIQEDPKFVESMAFDTDDDFERWLQEEMGDEYITDEEMVQGMLQYEQDSKERRKLRDAQSKIRLKDLPDKITTDFSVFGNKDE